jgi:tetratricopeptide (TPR) repeat protein
MIGWGYLNENLASIYKALFYVIKIFIIILILYFFFATAYWIFHDDNGIIIEPFQTANMKDVKGESILNGENIADLLRSKLLQINESNEYDPTEWDQNINMKGPVLEYHSIPSLSPEYYMVPEISDLAMVPSISRENDESRISEIGSVDVLGSSFPLGPILISLKHISGHRKKSITGSVQKYGSNILLIANLDDPDKGTFVWTVNDTIGDNQSIEDLIPKLVEDLAFKVAHGINRRGNPNSKNYPQYWFTLKSLTHGRDELKKYFAARDTKILNNSKNETLLALKHEPTYAGCLRYSLLYELGIAYLEINDIDNAEKVFQELTTVKPDLGYFGLGLIYSKKHQFNTSLAYYDKVTRINPKCAEAWKNKGNELYLLHRYEDAIKAYDKALKRYPNSRFIEIETELASQYAGICYNKGLVLYDLKRYDEAIECYEKALKFDPHAITWNNEGLALDRQGKFNEAIYAYESAINLDPDYATAWNNKGRVLDRQGKFEDAINSYDMAIKLDPDYAIAWHNRGSTFANMGRYNEAIQSYDRAIMSDSNFTWPLNNKGLALYDLKQYQEAIRAYNKAIALDPGYAIAWNNKGLALYALGMYNESIQAYDNAIRLDPQYAYPWNNKGQAFLRIGKYNESIDACNKAIKFDPTYAYPWNNRGLALNNLGRYDEAIQAYERAIELDPTYAVPWNNKGQALSVQGKYDEAIQAFDKAIEIDQKNRHTGEFQNSNS